MEQIPLLLRHQPRYELQVLVGQTMTMTMMMMLVLE